MAEEEVHGEARAAFLCLRDWNSPTKSNNKKGECRMNSTTFLQTIVYILLGGICISLVPVIRARRDFGFCRVVSRHRPR
jgi:hypothetical protein